MTSAEDREMMERISRLAGQINRHKNQQAGVGPARHARTHHHGGYSSGWRSGGFPHRGGHSSARMPVYRNRTLILNNGTQQSRSGDPDSGATSDASSSSWVTKNDRHLQLINSNVYKKDAQARAAAMEQTRRQKLANRDKQERAKLISHLNRMANSGGFGAANQQAVGDNKYEIAVQGVRFVVAKNGSKLVRVPGDGNSAKATPKMAVIGGVKFYRSKNGNLYRHGVVKAQRYVSWHLRAGQLTPAISGRQSGAVKKVNVPCKQFSMTGNIQHFLDRRPERHPPDRASVSDPRLTNRDTGSCTLGPRCRYVHDPHKVAICKDFLQQGECPSGDNCDLSHEPTPERTPTCLHFARDNCTKPDCKYAHVKVSPAAPVCRDFGFYGYCQKGAGCSDRHVFECPDFSNTGVCKIKGCKLPHRERASVLRRGASSRDQSGMEDEEMEDLSSDDDGESIDEDDVDSDEVDEFISQDENGGLDFAAQKDYIEL
ncbi:hypothetical protein MYCTH_2297028 [Thermothelomyces thermophilus ATCC 42464]|uniref:C3H1-type domain-containing protein n=1 Tax=Thermothelomyces thermophilus (strain ATCC 42464 / BCRC 31852 / DSM 1799) TaxID=573729 RepID=G2Q3T8_THET4|nr:uncharacterized protein MYCTH_2297028 [Thermothelomyces thermophilus ATCC 42464]AEO54441.1 hypothetical protein MYCTH_2297028 [Thermothelomyces thermophilus ATCC 42464]